MTRPCVSWLPGVELTRQFAVEELALLRYAKRGMLGAQWDEEEERWLFDVQRVSQLFLPRGVDRSTPAPHFGILGAACLAGENKRKPPALPERRSPTPLSAKTRCA